jgi:multiple sugar transport system permease protein
VSGTLQRGAVREQTRTTDLPSISLLARMLRGRRKRQLQSAAVFFALTIFTCFSLLPVLWIVSMSFKSGADIIAYPPPVIHFHPILSNYQSVLSQPDFLQPFKNTLIVTGGSLLLTLLIGLPAAYALATMDFPFKENFAFMFLSLRFAPELLVVIPLFTIFTKLNLTDSYFGLIIAYQLITFPLMVWMMRSFFEDVPKEIEEAVLVDGGTRFTAFRMIASRIVLPGIAASTVLAFIFAWNSYALPLVLAGPDRQVVTSAILGYVKYANVEWGKLAAGAVVSIIPGLIVAALLLRQMIRGLTAGTVKG